MPAEFWKWLNGQLEEHEWSDSDLAKKSGFSHSVISKARNGIQAIGYEACAKIADALYVPRSTVWKLAGYAPKESGTSPERDEWNGLFDMLGEPDREEMLQIARLKAKRGEKRERKKV